MNIRPRHWILIILLGALLWGLLIGFGWLLVYLGRL